MNINQLNINQLPRCFVVGPSVPKVVFQNYGKSHRIFHKPLIELQSIPLQRAINKKMQQQRYQALIFTSAHSVYESRRLFLFKKNSIDIPPVIVSVGQATEKAAKKLIDHSSFQPIFIRAQIETQEGILHLISTNIPSSNGPLLWPSSLESRHFLATSLREKGYSLDQIPLYRPTPKKNQFSWNYEDLVFFTCPSSVRSFFHWNTGHQHFWPSFQTIGPITDETLRLFQRNLDLSYGG